jgi:hypothetical protein
VRRAKFQKEDEDEEREEESRMGGASRAFILDCSTFRHSDLSTFDTPHHPKLFPMTNPPA